MEIVVKALLIRSKSEVTLQLVPLRSLAKCSRKTCEDSFKKILSCQVGNDKDRTRGGSFKDHRGTYKIETHLHGGEVRCPQDGERGLKVPEATDRIGKFCSMKKGQKIWINESGKETKQQEIFKGDRGQTSFTISWNKDFPGCNDGALYPDNAFVIDEVRAISFITFSGIIRFFRRSRICRMPAIASSEG